MLPSVGSGSSCQPQLNTPANYYPATAQLTSSRSYYDDNRRTAEVEFGLIEAQHRGGMWKKAQSVQSERRETGTAH